MAGFQSGNRIFLRVSGGPRGGVLTDDTVWYLAAVKTLFTGKMGRLGWGVGETSVSRSSLQLTPHAVLEPKYNPFKGFTHSTY